MNSSDLRDTFRKEVFDIATPVLWEDPEIFGYLDDAQNMFCRLVAGINDGTSGITRLAVSSGIDTVTTSPKILKIRHAYLVSDGSTIEIANYENLLTEGFRFDGRTGPVRKLITGITQEMVKLYPSPLNTDTIALLIERLPLKNITDESQLLEIEAQHHRHLLLWAKHLAYDKQDTETYQPKKSLEFKARFEEYCVLAKKEKERAMHKTRVIAYGGIGMNSNTGSYDSRGRSNGNY